MAETLSHPNDESYSHSLDCDIVWIDEPGDTTVRPCRPSLLAFMTALRARHLAAEAAKSDKTPENGQKS